MDQYLVAMLAVVLFGAFVIGWIIWGDHKGRVDSEPTESDGWLR